MREDLRHVLDRLRAARAPEFHRLIDGARLDADAAVPTVEALEPYRWFLERIGAGSRCSNPTSPSATSSRASGAASSSPRR